MADVFNKDPIAFVDQNEQFPILDETIGLTYEQWRTLVENTNFLYNNLGLSSIEIGSVTTRYPSPGSFSDVVIEHEKGEINGSKTDNLNFLFNIPTPRISATLTSEIVDDKTQPIMTLNTAPIRETIGTNRVVTGYEFEFHAKLPQTPMYYLMYTPQTLTKAEKEQARENIGAGTSDFSGLYADLVNKPTKLSDFENDLEFITIEQVPETDLSDYYTKTQTYNRYEVYNKSEVDNLLGAGVDLSNYYTKDETYNRYQIDRLFDNYDVDLSNYYTKEQVNQLIASIPETDLSNYYTKGEVDRIIENIDVDVDVDLSNYYTKPEVLNLISDIDVNLTDYYTKTETDTAITRKVNALSTVAKTGDYNDLSNKPERLSQFLNDSGFITQAVDNLTNYYTKTQIGQIFADSKVNFLFVTALPSVGQTNTIYFLASSGSTAFTEYVWINGGWELLGTVDLDLTDYYTKTEVDDLLPNMSNYYTKSETNSLLPDLSNYYSKIDLDGKVIPIGSLSEFFENGDGVVFYDETGNTRTAYTNEGINAFGADGRVSLTTERLQFGNTGLQVIGDINAVEDQTGLTYKSNISGVRYRFNDLFVQISGDVLEASLTKDTALNLNKVYLCTLDSLSGNYLTGHLYRIGGVSGAYTTVDITPLAESVIETISVNGVEQPISNKNVNISIPSRLSGFVNDTGYITAETTALTNYYTKNTIDGLLDDIPTFDDTNYYDKTEIDTKISNIPYVSYNIQTLTETGKSQARRNIGAGTSDFSGDYNDLINKPMVDSEFSTTSTNALQNNTISTKFGEVDKTVGEVVITANNAYSTAQDASATANGINTKLNSLVLVDNGDGTYTLKFSQDNVEVGTIVLPAEQYIKTIQQSIINDNVVFTWNNPTNDYPNGSYTVDLSPYVYTAGNGISTAKISATENRNVISVYLDDSDEDNKLFFNSTTGGLNVDLSGYATTAKLTSEINKINSTIGDIGTLLDKINGEIV